MNALQEIERLRDEGYVVRIAHRRPVAVSPSAKLTRAERDKLADAYGVNVPFKPKGGMTRVLIQAHKSDPTTVAEGFAICRPDENFNKRLGLTIALGRALCELNGERERRGQRKRLVLYSDGRLTRGDGSSVYDQEKEVTA